MDIILLLSDDIDTIGTYEQSNRMQQWYVQGDRFKIKEKGMEIEIERKRRADREEKRPMLKLLCPVRFLKRLLKSSLIMSSLF